MGTSLLEDQCYIANTKITSCQGGLVLYMAYNMAKSLVANYQLKMIFDVFLFQDHPFRRNKLLLFLRQFENEHLYM